MINLKIFPKILTQKLVSISLTSCVVFATLSSPVIAQTAPIPGGVQNPSDADCDQQDSLVNVTQNVLPTSAGWTRWCGQSSQGYRDYGTSTLENRAFCTSFPIPADLDETQDVVFSVNTGSQQGDNDTLTVGHFDTTTNTWDSARTSIGGTVNSSDATGGLPNLWYDFKLGSNNANVTNARAAPHPALGPTLEFASQDDTPILQTRLSYCKKNPIKTEAAGCSGREIYVNSKYGPLPVRVYCEGDPVLVSITSPSNASGYFVSFNRFDPVGWNFLSPTDPGAWECVNCTPPAYDLPANYANGALPANNPGELYLFGTATGPVWNSDNFFFRVVKCGGVTWGEDVIELGDLGKFENLGGIRKFPDISEPQPMPKGEPEKK